MATKTALQRLGRAVRDRRGELGLTQTEVAGAGGPSIVTVGQIERAQIPNPQPRTLHGLDKALGWERGTASGILRGVQPQAPSQPTPAARSATAEAIANDPDLHPVARAHLLNQYEILRHLPKELPAELEPAQTERRAAARPMSGGAPVSPMVQRKQAESDEMLEGLPSHPSIESEPGSGATPPAPGFRRT